MTWYFPIFSFVLDTGHALGAWHPVLAAGESFLML